MQSASSLPPSPRDGEHSTPSSSVCSSPSRAAFAAAQRAFPEEMTREVSRAMRARGLAVVDGTAPEVTRAIRWRCLRGVWAELGLPVELMGREAQRGDQEANQRLLSFLHGMQKNENEGGEENARRPKMPRSPPKFGNVIFASRHESTKKEAAAAACLAASAERDARALSPKRPDNATSKRCRSTLLRVAARLSDARGDVLSAAAASGGDGADAVAAAGASALLRLQCCLSEAQQELALCMRRP